MNRKLVKVPAALCALALMSAPLSVGAQTTQAEPAPAAVQADTPAPSAIPQSLADLGITDARVRGGDRGQWIEGTLPEGAPFQAKLSEDGQLRMLRSGDESALSAAILDKLLPEAVRTSPTFAEIGTISWINHGDKVVMVAGRDGDGQIVRAVFSPDGTLQRFGRMDPAKAGRMDGRGDRHHKGDGEWRKQGKDHGMRGGDGDKRRRDGREPDAKQAPVGLTDDAARGAVQGAGYSALGAITRDGPRTMVEAVNPNGENVLVELGPRGDVVRETVR